MAAPTIDLRDRPTEERSVVPRRATRVLVRPIASPLPLGLVGLAAATITLSGLQLEWFEAAEASIVAVVLLAFAAPAQFVASVFGFLARDEVAATAMGVLAATWAVTGIVMASNPPGSTSDALGVLLLVSAGAMAIVAAASASLGNVLSTVVLSLVVLRFLSGGIYQLGDDDLWRTVTGVVGVVLGAAAGGAALLLALRDARRHTHKRAAVRS